MREGDVLSVPGARRAGGESQAAAYLAALGVRSLPRLTTPFDPGYSPAELASHLDQSGHLFAALKLSMVGWMLASERSTRAKLEAARARSVPTVAGGSSFEVAVAQGRLREYVHLCADLGFDRIECGAGFTDMRLAPRTAVAVVRAYGLDVQYEIGEKHGGALSRDAADALVRQGYEWLEAGAGEIVVEARESARNVGVFDADGGLDVDIAERLIQAFGLEWVSFEAPTKSSQFALMKHFGPGVRLSNVRLEEVLRVEGYRRGLHSDAFACARLRPLRPVPALRPLVAET
jgi:phosphosulfolactate synthase